MGQDCCTTETCCAPGPTSTYGRRGYIVRRYYSREERAAWLEGYAEALENELTGVRERIAHLRGEDAEAGEA